MKILIADDNLYLVRILSPAAVFDALASPRPYRGAMSTDEALAQLHFDMSRGRLDPSLVRCFTEIIGSVEHGALVSARAS